MNNGDSIQTCIMALEKPRDYEKGITILTDESQAPLIIKPASCYTIYVKTDKKANETTIPKAKSEFLDPVEAIELTKTRQEARVKADLSYQENLANNNNAIVIKNSADDPKNDPHLAELLKNAEAGDAKAQYKLGLAFYEGCKGPPVKSSAGIIHVRIILRQNTSLAANWFRKSAAQGYSEAQFMLGKCYLAGNGVEKNKGEAIKWLKVATDQGNKEAEAELNKHENNPQSSTNPPQNP
jgi:TPR repeat protein